MGHGYVDTISVPLHLASTSAPAKSSKGKGKEQQQKGGASGETYDVVAGWTPEEKDQMQRKVHMASLLGYSTVILNISISASTNPSTLSFPTPLFPEMDPRTAPPGTEGMVLQLWRVHVNDLSEEAIKSTGTRGYYGFSNSTAPLYPAATTLLSATALSLPVFSHLALSVCPPSPFAPTLVTFDPSLSPRLPFQLKRGLVNSLLRAGVMFEIVLRGMVKQDDAIGGAGSRRRNWIAGAREIVRATGGRNVVLSSGAETAGEMRGSEDIVNLCTLIGLTPAQAKDALTTNPQKAILRGSESFLLLVPSHMYSLP
ncbi:RNase P subunit p30 family protein [Pseudohyphozyma bogoriensis]|nr:RNase P subunit p30 family protein [Pseudohyphozyma bogoriensis]